MLNKITPGRYLAFSALMLIVALVVQLKLKKDCAWDGCYPTAEPTVAGSLFGLPILVFQIEILLGIILWIIKRTKRAK